MERGLFFVPVMNLPTGKFTYTFLCFFSTRKSMIPQSAKEVQPLWKEPAICCYFSAEISQKMGKLITRPRNV